MQIFHTLAFMAFAALGAAQTCSEHVECQSSADSPFYHDVDQLIANVRDAHHDSECFADMMGEESHRCGNTIKSYTGKHGGAVFSFCSGDMDEWQEVNSQREQYCKTRGPGRMMCNWCHGYMEPEEVADKLQAIMDKCRDDYPHRVGGIFHTNRGGQIRLYTAPAH